MQLTLITVGTVKEPYLREALTEYGKRIRALADFREVTIPEVRITDEDDPGKVGYALSCEGEKLLAAAPRDAYKIALCVEGREMTSEELAATLRSAGDTRGKVALFIGSSHGLSPAVKAACDLRLSFSRLTFPHQLMRVMVAESLYRSLTIIAGKKYHK